MSGQNIFIDECMLFWHVDCWQDMTVYSV